MHVVWLWLVIVVSVLSIGICRAEEKAAGEKQKVMPKKVQVDTNYDGKADRIEYYDASGQVTKSESDTNGNGTIDEWVTYEGGRPAKSARDTNDDGRPDIWVDY